MSVVTDTPARSEENFRVTRSRRNVAWTGAGALIVVVVLALFPYIVYSGTTSLMVQAFIVITLASMWNLLAGYAGLVSVGQQAFVGLGAYFVLILAQHSLSPFGGLPVAAVRRRAAHRSAGMLVSAVSPRVDGARVSVGRTRGGQTGLADREHPAQGGLRRGRAVLDRGSGRLGGGGAPRPGEAGARRSGRDHVLLGRLVHRQDVLVLVDDGVADDEHAVVGNALDQVDELVEAAVLAQRVEMLADMRLEHVEMAIDQLG